MKTSKLIQKLNSRILILVLLSVTLIVSNIWIWTECSTTKDSYEEKLLKAETVYLNKITRKDIQLTEAKQKEGECRSKFNDQGLLLKTKNSSLDSTTVALAHEKTAVATLEKREAVLLDSLKIARQKAAAAYSKGYHSGGKHAIEVLSKKEETRLFGSPLEVSNATKSLTEPPKLGIFTDAPFKSVLFFTFLFLSLGIFSLRSLVSGLGL